MEERNNLFKKDFSLEEMKKIRELEKLTLRKKKINKFIMEKRNILNSDIQNNYVNNLAFSNINEQFQIIRNGRIIFFLEDSIKEKDDNKIIFYLCLILEYLKINDNKLEEKNILINLNQPNSISNILIQLLMTSDKIPILYFSSFNLIQLTYYSNELCEFIKQNISILNNIINKFTTYYAENHLLSNIYNIFGNLFDNENDYKLLLNTNFFQSFFQSIKLFNTEDYSIENFSYLESLMWILIKFLEKQTNTKIDIRQNLIESIPKLIKIIRMFYYSNDTDLLFQLLQNIYIISNLEDKLIEIIIENGIIMNICNLFEYLFTELPQNENLIILDCYCVNECLKIFINIFTIDTNILQIYYNNELSLVINKLVYTYRIYQNSECNIQDSIINILFNLATFPEIISINHIFQDEKLLNIINKYYSKNNIYKCLIFFDNIIIGHPTLVEKCIDLNYFDIIVLGLNEEFFGNLKYDIIKMEFQVLSRLILLDTNSKVKKMIKKEFINRNIKELIDKIFSNEKNEQLNLMFDEFIQLYEKQYNI